uniref:Uncharacterized protein n=1 Tax=Biomphalaria glabrata TaxID=6526 RepID=A0A2C9LJX6_BIOGL
VARLTTPAMVRISVKSPGTTILSTIASNVQKEDANVQIRQSPLRVLTPPVSVTVCSPSACGLLNTWWTKPTSRTTRRSVKLMFTAVTAVSIISVTWRLIPALSRHTDKTVTLA